MHVTYNLEETAESTIGRIQQRLEKDGYLFTRGELSWSYDVQGGAAKRDLTMCEFWARKHLAPKYRDYYFIEISGTARRTDDAPGCRVEVDFVEMHHTYVFIDSERSRPRFDLR